MAAIIGYIVICTAALFWLAQLIDIVWRGVEYFESHCHKLVWFLVVLIGNIVGAIWYFVWKRQAVTAKLVQQAEKQIRQEAKPDE